MDVKPKEAGEKTTITVLVTGANSGLGFAICCRLIDEFLFTRPQSQTLHLLFSTRDPTKSEETRKRLNAHLQKTLYNAGAGISLLLEGRVKLEGVLLDLTKLLTVKALAQQMLARGRHLDAVVWNAGIAGWTGVNYFKATWDILRGFIQATTYPEYMNCDVEGALAKPQLGGYGSVHMFPEPHLGRVFLSNVFGHYVLTHWLAPLMNSDTRIVWISSISGTPDRFNLEDLQGVRAEQAYESSKRLTDLLVLTYGLPSTQTSVKAFLTATQPPETKQTPATASGKNPQMYLTHPGVVATSISGLDWVMTIFMFMAMYFSRWLGSPWHPISAYKGAVSAVFTVLAPASQLADLELRDGKGKWGSASDVFGNERVARTEIEGWGYGGEIGGEVPSGSVASRRRGRGGTTKETREDSEELGRKVWREMEELRVEWEKRLGRVEADGNEAVDV